LSSVWVRDKNTGWVLEVVTEKAAERLCEEEREKRIFGRCLIYKIVLLGDQVRGEGKGGLNRRGFWGVV